MINIKFCPECGKILLPKKKGKVKMLACSKCDYEEKIQSKDEYEIEEEVSHRSNEKTEVVVIDKEDVFSEEDIEERRERFVEGIDFFETE